MTGIESRVVVSAAMAGRVVHRCRRLGQAGHGQNQDKGQSCDENSYGRLAKHCTLRGNPFEQRIALVPEQ